MIYFSVALSTCRQCYITEHVTPPAATVNK